MDILITAAVVLGMIAVVALAIHTLNARHHHRHLAAARYDHGLAAFDGSKGGAEDVTSRPSTVPPPP
ncbi:hypothetical protein ABZ454_29425 [Streptomyces sp. NPDC005803]|uniref:hypothetical protein n=1 Tax=Streptomyces sp. NPDC005803 TaxID=3154297 RepID=UPI003402FEC4